MLTFGIFFTRSRLATARRLLSSLSPSLPCRASIASSSGKFGGFCSVPFPSLSLVTPLPLLPTTVLNTLTQKYSLTRELEKKFSDRHVLILASRRILPRPKRSTRSRNTQKQKRPRSRTLTAVHDAILTDLVFPVEIVGKRLRTKEDGSKTLKVILDEKEKGGVDYRLDTYSEVYRKLTGRGVVFEFPQTGAADY